MNNYNKITYCSECLMPSSRPRITFKDQMRGSFLGPNYNEQKIEEHLKSLKANYSKYKSNDLMQVYLLMLTPQWSSA